MNQSFMSKFPWGEPTYFKEKLLAMAMDRYTLSSEDMEKYGICLQWIDFIPKLHTIRPVSDRYKVGQMQQPFYWLGKPYKDPIYRFMPMIPLVSKQTISIRGTYPNINVAIDGRNITYNELKQLAKNDGFSCVEDFFIWFNKDFEGEIRHYTDLRY